MRRKIIILVGILLLVSAAGSYWYLQLRTPEDPIPESGIFVMVDPIPEADTGAMEDSPCRHSM